MNELERLDSIIDTIRARIAEHDEPDDFEREYVAGLSDALRIVEAAADRIR